MSQVVGISQKIKRAWLDVVLDRLAKTTDAAELRVFLDQHLKDELPGPESRAKNSGIILRIWSGIPANRIALRNRAVALLPCISGQERSGCIGDDRISLSVLPGYCRGCRSPAGPPGRLHHSPSPRTDADDLRPDRATSKRGGGQKLITTLVDWGKYFDPRKRGATSCSPAR